VAVDTRKGEQFAPDFLKLNPNGKVPVLVDDGQVVRVGRTVEVERDHPGLHRGRSPSHSPIAGADQPLRKAR
jgi:hypothetical protein